MEQRDPNKRLSIGMDALRAIPTLEALSSARSGKSSARGLPPLSGRRRGSEKGGATAIVSPREQTDGSNRPRSPSSARSNSSVGPSLLTVAAASESKHGESVESPSATLITETPSTFSSNTGAVTPRSATPQPTATTISPRSSAQYSSPASPVSDVPPRLIANPIPTPTASPIAPGSRARSPSVSVVRGTGPQISLSISFSWATDNTASQAWSSMASPKARALVAKMNARNELFATWKAMDTASEERIHELRIKDEQFRQLIENSQTNEDSGAKEQYQAKRWLIQIELRQLALQHEMVKQQRRMMLEQPHLKLTAEEEKIFAENVRKPGGQFGARTGGWADRPSSSSSQFAIVSTGDVSLAAPVSSRQALVEPKRVSGVTMGAKSRAWRTPMGQKTKMYPRNFTKTLPLWQTASMMLPPPSLSASSSPSFLPSVFASRSFSPSSSLPPGSQFFL